ncbi:hypothetical protein CRG98_029569 [Punica granatum]|uniref:Uncharacterized protein n=1 Tax=Punica granatum TaxID=22663 RepID=A0A2I0J1X8_PUNGR|nr:hypothetical protein CRG98_029569 [Punica granatum]
MRGQNPKAGPKPNAVNAGPEPDAGPNPDVVNAVSEPDAGPEPDVSVGKRTGLVGVVRARQECVHGQGGGMLARRGRTHSVVLVDVLSVPVLVCGDSVGPSCVDGLCRGTNKRPSKASLTKTKGRLTYCAHPNFVSLGHACARLNATRLGSVHLPGDARRTHVRRSRHLPFYDPKVEGRQVTRV